VGPSAGLDAVEKRNMSYTCQELNHGYLVLNIVVYLGKCYVEGLLGLLMNMCDLTFMFVDFCLDAKFRFDDNADFRQKEVFALRDWSQEDEKEVEASKFNLNYIALDGKVIILY
jgi:hypothetical protein